MARKRSQLKTHGLPQGGMVMGNVGGAGVLDPTTLPLPETSLRRWFGDVAAVEAFSVPVRPRQQ